MEEKLRNLRNLRNLITQKYNIVYETTYIKEDEENKDEVYQLDILKAFQLEEYEDDVIDNIQFELYQLLKTNPRFIKLCIKLSNNIMCEEPEYGFIFLFSYSYFHLTHKYICSVLNYCNEEEHLKNLEELIL